MVVTQFLSILFTIQFSFFTPSTLSRVRKSGRTLKSHPTYKQITNRSEWRGCYSIFVNFIYHIIRFQLRWDSSRCLSITGRLYLEKEYNFFKLYISSVRFSRIVCFSFARNRGKHNSGFWLSSWQREFQAYKGTSGFSYATQITWYKKREFYGK